MQMFCPACESAFPGVSRCPRCGGLMLMPHEVSPDASHERSDAAPLLPRPTAGGRVAVGTVLALGLYLALRKLAMGAVLAASPDPDGWWASFRGLAAVHASQALAVIFGAVIAAAGRASGYPLGLAVGLVCGGLFLAYEIVGGAPPHDLVLYLQAPVLALLGLVAGVFGSRIWGAAPKLDIPLPNASKLSSIRLMEDSKLDPGRPTAWLRILAGAAIMVIGVSCADQFRSTLQKNSGGILRVSSLGQGEFITWQFATFAVLLGGVTAGAATGAGIWHGLLTGLLGGVGILGMSAKTGGLPPIEWWLYQLQLDGQPLSAPPVLTAIVGSVFLIGVLGGWLGSALFLPLAPEHLRKRLRAHSE